MHDLSFARWGNLFKDVQPYACARHYAHTTNMPTSIPGLNPFQLEKRKIPENELARMQLFHSWKNCFVEFSTLVVGAMFSVQNFRFAAICFELEGI